MAGDSGKPIESEIARSEKYALNKGALTIVIEAVVR